MKRYPLSLAIGVGGLFAWCFAPAFAGQSFAFRDAAHFYYPLFELVRDEWGAGRVPLWNPYENAGVPLLASGTASVFYPGKLLFALPLPYGWLYTAYVVGHLLLAAFTVFWTARRWGSSMLAAGLCGIAYAFSGNVLTQHANVVYLVGAAWLPAALWCGERLLATRRVMDAGKLAAALAMMVLGGDPQLAYHAGLAIAGYALLDWRDERALPAGEARAGGRWWRGRFAVLTLAAAGAGLLTAVQVLPTAEFVRLSGRTAYSLPRSVFDVPGYLLNTPERPTGWYSSLLGKPEADAPATMSAEDFSVSPLRVAGLFWPNFSGRQFPVHRRWLRGLMPNERLWAPTLYLGVLPLAFGMCAWSIFAKDVRVRWLSWLALIAVLASLGRYGLGWCVSRILGEGASTLPIGEGFGGVNWLFNLLLPGHANFRYPGKLMVIATLAICLLAARQWDRVFDKEHDGGARAEQTVWWLRWLVIASLIILVLLIVTWPIWQHGWLRLVPPDPLFGRLERALTARDLLGSLAQAAAVGGVSAWLIVQHGSRRRRYRHAPSALLLLAAIDLGFANGWLVQYAPANQWRTTSQAAAVVRELASPGQAGGAPLRVYRGRPWLPAKWGNSSTEERLAQAVEWDRDTLFPKYNLRERIGVFHAAGTLSPADWEVVRNQAENLAQEPESQLPGAAGWLNMLAAEWLVVSSPSFWPDAGERFTQPRTSYSIPSAVVLKNAQALPRAWIVHDWEAIPAVIGNQPQRLRQIAQQTLLPDGRPRDFRSSAVVEAEDAPPPVSSASAAEESCEITHHDPLRVEVTATLTAPGLVVLSEQFYPGWRLSVGSEGAEERELPILRTNGILRGAFLPAGRHHLVYQYRPHAFRYGAMISATAWAVLFGIAIRSMLQARATSHEGASGTKPAPAA